MPLTRRALLHAVGAAGLAALVRTGARAQDAKRAAVAQAQQPAGSQAMSTRAIPRTGEPIPVIGLGTWQTFDVGSGAAERAPVVQVLRRFLAAGGRVIDSSPMYGRAEAVTGDALAELGAIGKPFLATKVWTRGKAAGIEQMERSLSRMRTERIDLMQVHNLLDWQAHLPVLREWKQAGRVRYIGITHYASSAFADLERLMRSETLDFVQLPYNVLHREAEERLLPAARDTGTAVLVMQPFAEGRLFDLVKGKAPPDWAAEIDCTSWAQLFLKFILGHPAVTCPLPATSKTKHVEDNVQAGRGRLPDAALRRKLIALLEA
jgi:aryl-alcohol dehydrogenase-like predicted oxidoreductase